MRKIGADALKLVLADDRVILRRNRRAILTEPEAHCRNDMVALCADNSIEWEPSLMMNMRIASEHWPLTLPGSEIPSRRSTFWSRTSAGGKLSVVDTAVGSMPLWEISCATGWRDALQGAEALWHKCRSTTVDNRC